VKWSSEPWASPNGWNRVRAACRQAKRNARDISGRLADNGIATAAQAIVVLWGGDIRNWSADASVRQVDSTTVVAGTAIRTWRYTIHSTALDPSECGAVVAALRR
jgi:hypothetical protein